MNKYIKMLLVSFLPLSAYAQSVQECGDKDIQTGMEYRPNGIDIPVYLKPTEKSEKLINEKLSKAINETRYITFSNEYKVKEVCHNDKKTWSLVRAVEPSYLSDSHYGWVKRSSLKREKLDENGFRIIEEEDVTWNKRTKDYKDLIIQTLNKIHRENKNCAKIDVSVLDRSSAKGNKENPVFYITCGEGISAFNVFFSLSDMKNNISQNIVYISREKAINLCKNNLREKFEPFASVDFSNVLDLSYIKHPNGRVSLSSSFFIKKKKEESEKYSVKCLFEKGTLLETVIDRVHN